MCSSSEDVQNKQGCAVQINHSFSTREDVQYESGTSSVQMRLCSTSQVDHQVLVQGGTTQRYFSLNESLLLLMYQVKTVSSLWWAAKIN